MRIRPLAMAATALTTAVICQAQGGALSEGAYRRHVTAMIPGRPDGLLVMPAFVDIRLGADRVYEIETKAARLLGKYRLVGDSIFFDRETVNGTITEIAGTHRGDTLLLSIRPADLSSPLSVTGGPFAYVRWGAEPQRPRVLTPRLVTFPTFPHPVPAKVRGTRVTADFDIGDAGQILDVGFTPTRDKGYNRELDRLFRQMKFHRPCWRTARRFGRSIA